MSTTILAIESSCDDTSAAVVRDGFELSNVIANQQVHRAYGGVVPELASRAHQQNIVPVVDKALKDAGVRPEELSAVAFTRGPGLLGSLLVGSSFAKGLALALGVPLVEVNHLHAHVLALFLKDPAQPLRPVPSFPFLCLLVSGGHTQLVLARDYLDLEIVGQTQDDAAGEAFDKCAKTIGLPYPGGPVVDRLAQSGDEKAFVFKPARVPGYDFSFSGLKTSFLYTVRDKARHDPDFVRSRTPDLCASIQRAIVDSLLEKLEKAADELGIREIGLGGGVSANSALRRELLALAQRKGWTAHLPPLRLTTDNAAMIGITAHHKFLAGQFAEQHLPAQARYPLPSQADNLHKTSSP